MSNIYMNNVSIKLTQPLLQHLQIIPSFTPSDPFTFFTYDVASASDITAALTAPRRRIRKGCFGRVSSS